MLENGESYPQGTTVIVTEQTAGRGRFRRRWISDHRTICFSVLVKPVLPLGRLFMLNLIAPLAIYQALQRLGYKLELKFPNDLLAAGRKVAGVLVETCIRGGELEFAVVGYGINHQGVPGGIEAPRLPPVALSELERSGAGSSDGPPAASELTAAVRDALLSLLQSPQETVLADYGVALGDYLGFFRLPDGQMLAGRVKGFSKNGEVLLQTMDGVIVLPDGAEWSGT